MPIMRLVFSLLGRGKRRPERSARFRPQLTALENRWVPSTITEFALPPLSFGGSLGAAALTGGPDGNVWFSDPHAGAVGRITPDGQVTEFATPGISAAAITTGPDGNLWFLNDSLTESGSPAIGRITPAGLVTTFTLPDDFTQPSQITAGPDGNVWFTENIYPTGEKVGRITPAGQITEFTVPVPPGVVGNIDSIAAGPDGNLWFLHDAILARITPTGALTDHVADNAGVALTVGPDGNLWTAGTRFNTQTGAVVGDFVDRISLSGSVTSFDVGTTNGSPESISAGPDGNLWFTEPDANQIGRITPAGQITLFTVPTPGSQPTGITAGPNGNIWFTEAGSRHIGEYFLTGTPPAAAAPTTTALAADVSAPAVGQTVHLKAIVASAAGTPGGTVTFFDGNTALGTVSLDAGGEAVLTTAFGTAGSHALTAVFNGTAAFAPSRSAALNEAVSQAATTTTLTASSNPAPVGQPLVLTVTVTPAFTGAGAPTGTVILRDGSNTIGFATLDASGRATFTFVPGQVVGTGRHRSTILPKGVHHLSVSYSGDGNFAASNSVPLDLTVV
jgi:streptogramin lyase